MKFLNKQQSDVSRFEQTRTINCYFDKRLKEQKY